MLQYCGSCGARVIMSALSNLIKMARGAKGIDIQLSVPHVVSCGNAGSRYRGDQGAAHQCVFSAGSVAHTIGQPNMVYSSDSKEGFCGDAVWMCTAMNAAGTFGEACVSIDIPMRRSRSTDRSRVRMSL